jgi:alpha-beta hydrolase superfamily lysophospholipase
MLAAPQDPAAVFDTFADRLAAAGVDFGGGDDAGFSDSPSKLLHGAKEALRQLSYWKMKNRAGVVGQRGLGPVIGRLAAEFPPVRVHLIGHSFGARLVSYALAGVGDLQPSPIKSVTLLQGAYSRFAFTEALPFRSGVGALAGRLDRVDGPLAVCFSRHDRALGTFYPSRRRPPAMTQQPRTPWCVAGDGIRRRVRRASSHAGAGGYAVSVPVLDDSQPGCTGCRHPGQLTLGRA